MKKEQIVIWYRKHSLILRIIKKQMKNPISIVMVNGGICSQMQQYLIGKYLMDKGRNVSFDLSFYSTYELGGVNTRNFDLLKLFPKLEFTIETPIKVKYYKKMFRYVPENKTKKYFDQIPESPVYVDGYYDVDPEMYNNFHKYFQIDNDIIKFDEINKQFYDRIMNDEKSVGVHVRRGDMTVTGNYWKVLKPLYYRQAMEMFDFGEYTFYFFSDEREWIKENIIPIFEKKIKYVFVDSNGSDRGYLDLLLLSTCKHQIASQGSFGKYAWLLNRSEGKKLIVPNCGIANELIETNYGKNISFIELNQDNCENP